MRAHGAVEPRLASGTRHIACMDQVDGVPVPVARVVRGLPLGRSVADAENPLAMQDLDDRSDTRSRRVPAAAAAVFAAMRDPRRVARWWGPQGFRNTIHTFEFREGGRWLLTMHGPDGSNFDSDNRFTRLVPDRLVEIEHFTGHHFVLTVELIPQAQATEIAWRQTFDSAEHYASIAPFVTAANEQNLERLAAEVARGAGGGAG